MPYFYDCGNGSGGGGDPIYGNGTPSFIDGDVDTTPGSARTLVSSTLATKQRTLSQILINCPLPGFWIAEADSVIIASGRVGAGHPESIFTFIPRRILSEGTLFTLKFTARAGPVTDVRYHVMSSVL